MKKGRKLWMLLLIVLMAGSLVISCDWNNNDGDDNGTGTPTPGTGEPTDQITLSGTVADWPLQETATVRAVADGGAAEPVTLATSDIGTDGSFSLTVPTPPDGTILTLAQTQEEFLPGAGDGVVADPQELQILMLTDLEVLSGADTLGTLMKMGGPQGFSIAAWVFADRDATITGSDIAQVDIDDDGTAENILMTFDLTLNQGWNEVYIDPTFGDDPATPEVEDATAVVNGTAPAGMEWVAIGDFSPTPTPGHRRAYAGHRRAHAGYR